MEPGLPCRISGSQASCFAELLRGPCSLCQHPQCQGAWKEACPSFQPTAVYTRELICIDYLYHQTGQALQDVHPDSEETEQMLEDVGTEEELDVESFEDAGLSLSLDPTIELLDLSITRTISSASIPIPSSLHLSASRSAAAATEQHLRYALRPISPPCQFKTSCSATTSFQATVPPAATAGPTASPPTTHAAPQQQLPLDVPNRIMSGLSAVTTGSASVLPLLPTTLTTTVPAAAATAMAGL